MAYQVLNKVIHINLYLADSMYIRDKNNMFREYLRRKSNASESAEKIEEIEFSKLPVVVEIFNHRRMREILDEHDRRSNLHRNNKRFLNYLENTSGFLRLAELPASIFDDLEELRVRFPNFSMVIDFYKKQFALSLLVDKSVFAASPLLIVGPPGIGKTAFCHDLAKLVNTHFELISLSGMTASFVLGGMSSGWAEGKPGKVVEAIARNGVGNPLLVLDEIDKAGGDKRYDPLGVLLQLLEKQTAKSFVIASRMEPRSIQCELTNACGSAVLKAREQSRLENTPFEIGLDDLVLSSTAQSLIPRLDSVYVN